VRVLTGIGGSPSDIVQEEARRIGLPGTSLYISEKGDAELDRMTAESYARILQEELPQMLEDPTYTELRTPARQRDFLQRYVFPVLKRAALAEARLGVGEKRYKAGTLKGEAARKAARQLRLIDELEGALPPEERLESEEPDQIGAPPPGPPGPVQVGEPPPTF
jgi:hypothetical protein